MASKGPWLTVEYSSTISAVVQKVRIFRISFLYLHTVFFLRLTVALNRKWLIVSPGVKVTASPNGAAAAMTILPSRLILIKIKLVTKSLPVLFGAYTKINKLLCYEKWLKWSLARTTHSSTASRVSHGSLSVTNKSISYTTLVS